MPLQFDMFLEQNIFASAEPVSGERTRVLQAAAIEEARMVDYLAATGRYRILRRLEPRPVAKTLRAEYPLRGAIIDTETTGLSRHSNEIIEIGAVAFTFDGLGAIGDVIGHYAGLQQPSSLIPAEITALTGLTDEMVAGHKIDMGALCSLIEPADLIIAHNASFDRPFCEVFSPLFSRKAWACSNSEIDWTARGFEGTKLGYLVGQAGYFHQGHRAIDDCFALLEILDHVSVGAAETPFAELYRASQRSMVRIFAEHSPFDMKDQLKARGYRWSDGSDGRLKSWWVEVDESNLASELSYLRTEIYCHPEADPPTRFLTAYDRFRA